MTTNLTAGVHRLRGRRASQVLGDTHGDWRVFRLPPGIRDRTTFFDAVRAVLPLDPPVVTDRSCDALADSLWEGLSVLPDKKIVITWPRHHEFQSEHPFDANIAETILSDLVESLIDQDAIGGKAKELAVVFA